MTCYHPLKAFVLGIKQNGKKELKICSYNIDHLELINNKLVPVYDKTRSQYASKVYKEYIEIPCGKCIGCRLKYSREWANRCMLELPYHSESWFVTLTYDDEHLPTSTVVTEDGEKGEVHSLVKKDLQDFIKRLRRCLDYRISYYACGEYGDASSRPHYHLIIFGLKLYDLKVWSRTSSGILYNSKFLSDRWENRGHVVVAEVNWNTCAYVARYIMKKQKGEGAEVYSRLGIQPEFTTMSLKPAIGKKYFDEHKDEIYKHSYMILPEGRKIYPPRYYDSLYDVQYPSDFAIIKERRRLSAEHNRVNMLRHTDLDYQSILAIKEVYKKECLKKLIRSV